MADQEGTRTASGGSGTNPVPKAGSAASGQTQRQGAPASFIPVQSNAPAPQGPGEQRGASGPVASARHARGGEGPNAGHGGKTDAPSFEGNASGRVQAGDDFPRTVGASAQVGAGVAPQPPIATDRASTAASASAAASAHQGASQQPTPAVPTGAGSMPQAQGPAPQASTGSGAASTAPSAKGGKKKLKIGIAVVAVIVVLAVIGSLSGGASSDSGSTDQSDQSQQARDSDSSTTQQAPAEQEKPKVDKSMLQASIKQWEGLTPDGWTPESWQRFSDSLAKAKEVNADPNASQSSVDSANSVLVANHGALKEVFDPNKYERPAFKDVARNPDSFKGKKIAFTGKVLQVLEGTSETDLRIATDGGYDDVVFVGFDPSILGGTHVLEDDKVTVYGTCIGQYSYQSTMGGTISLPGLYADQVEIK